MNAKLRVNLSQEMYVIRHDFKRLNRRLMLLTDLRNNLFQAFCHLKGQYLAPVIRAPHHMIVAGVIDIRFDWYAVFIFMPPFYSNELHNVKHSCRASHPYG